MHSALDETNSLAHFDPSILLLACEVNSRVPVAALSNRLGLKLELYGFNSVVRMVSQFYRFFN